MNEIKVGSYVGNGAAQNISIGFVPTCVIIDNATDGDQVSIGFPGAMADGSAIAIVGAAGPVLDAANQVSAYAGAAGSAGAGFTVGTDLSEAAKTFRYIAFRGAAPA